MKLQLLSDLHLESSSFTLKPHPDADVIILAGDITTQQSYGRFFDLLAQAQDLPVLYIPGNHEFYGSSPWRTRRELEDIFEDRPNVYALDGAYVDLHGVRFVGDILWSDFRLPFRHANGGIFTDPELAKQHAGKGISDFFRIANFEPAHAAASHAHAREYLREHCNTGIPTVFITHFLPSAKSIDAQFADSPLNPYFASNCEDLMTPNIKLWVHGHTHSSCDYVHGQTRVVCNPKGYTAKENPKFDPQLLIEVTP